MKHQKIEREINNIIIHANQVSDSVLEQTRKSMKGNQIQLKPQQSFAIHKMLKPTILVPLFIVLLLCTISISLAIIEKEKYNYITKINNSYTYSELQKESISSIQQYNLDNNTKYYYFKDLIVISSYELLSSNTSVGFEETYQYQEYTITMYFHSSDIKYDIDKNYPKEQRQYFGDFKYWYLKEENLIYIYTIPSTMEYYITIDSDNSNLVEEILPYFIKSQS